MAEYTGSPLVLSFINPAGTLTLNTDYRSLSDDPSVGLVDASAGNDTHKTYLTTLIDNKYSYSGVAQTAGSLMKSQLAPSTKGTLIIGREGTTSGSPKETCPVICMGAKFKYQYDNITEITCDFQANGAAVDSAY